MKKRILATAVTLALGAPLAVQAAETSDHSFTGNVGVFTNYLFRGVSQTSEKPAVQGGFDYGHSSGAYAGVWGSNISWLSDFGVYTASSLELDAYAGYKGSIGKTGIGYDVGGIFYYYPGDKLAFVTSANTTEVYGAVSWEFLTAKVSYAVGDYFGIASSDGTLYFDVSASYALGKTGVTLSAHVGSLKMAGTGNDVLDYTDWNIGASYALPKDFVVGAVYSDNDGAVALYSPGTSDWITKQAVVYLKKSF